jgi:drug/metabolite transporter (DMT)-like permease
VSTAGDPTRIDETRKGPPTMLIAMILLSVGLAAVAQLALKEGMNQVNAELAPAKFSLNGDSLRVVVGQPFVWGGLVLFGFSAIVWLVVLSRASLSFAYPFAALTYVMILLFDHFVLDEPVPALRWAGVGFIATGIILVSRTPHN